MSNNIVVVDASLAIKWVLREEDSYVAGKLLAHWGREKTKPTAPALFAYEITNIMYRQVVAKKITYAEASKGLAKIFSVGILLHSSSLHDVSTRAMELAHQFNLPATYDAHYLALTEIENCECWTADKKLLNAVKGKISWVHSLDDYILSGDDLS
ncbi:MAG TPA: PIN domain nuclease [Ktedonobacter sp.]|nr:PIN domain nuclease [Ktedonobacter sp.]